MNISTQPKNKLITNICLLLCVVSFFVGAWVENWSVAYELRIYNQAQQLKTRCEKDLPRSETCVLMYLNPDEIKTLGKDIDKE